MSVKKEGNEVPEYNVFIPSEDKGIEVEDLMKQAFFERDKAVEEERKKWAKKLHIESRRSFWWAVMFFITFAIFIIIFSQYMTISSELLFVDTEVKELCEILGHTTYARTDVGIWCVDGDPFKSQLVSSSILWYLNEYYGLKKYDIREYSVDYSKCEIEPEVKYYTNYQTMMVTC